MKKNMLFLLPFLLVVFSMNCGVAERLKNIKIYDDSPRMDEVGYDNSVSMEDNGELNIIRSFIKSGDLIFDVGANIGEWSGSVFDIVNF